jgi:hypothetical protein
VVAGDGFLAEPVLVVGEDALGDKEGGGAVLGDVVDRRFDPGLSGRSRDLDQRGAGIGRLLVRGRSARGEVAGVEVVVLIGVAV